ncbi:glycoside hydrolase family 28 protein [Rhabdobacter roseus]|uniref:Glycoside hydrolase family 28 protein n=1 Tax=Rhabdobacter roseus TaxID=1655419 RepID=A0A840TVI1_9BACT|nr:glycosyl hydrolase family 28 protein [Rhabdobacter roseus]MBB5285273.1 hypothetical protein [Rhabdobacter roseus]
MTSKFAILSATFYLTTCLLAYGQSIFSITDFGATQDSTVNNAKAIQQAIDACAKAGGGQVLVPNGSFHTGTLFLKSHVKLYLEAGAVLVGSVDTTDYARDAMTGRKALIIANGQKNISIVGDGTIHGRGEHPIFYSNDRANGLKDRPNTLSFAACEQVVLKDFTLRNGTRWCVMLKESDHITVDNIRIISRAVANNDGLDITDCHHVRVSNSYFDCGDDAICPKSESGRGVKNLAITNCIVKSESNAIKFGTASVGGFSDVVVSNCVLFDTRLSGLALELVDGGVMERITINNITMHNVNGSIFVKLGHRQGQAPGVLRNVHFSNITADGIGEWQPDRSAPYFKVPNDQKIGVLVVGLPGALVEDVSFDHIKLQFSGGGTAEDAKRNMEDKPSVYPEYSNFGVTPAFAFNIRHVKNISLNNISVSTLQKDLRPALLIENAENVSLQSFRVHSVFAGTAMLRLKDVASLRIADCQPRGNAQQAFIQLEGKNQGILLQNNDLSNIGRVFPTTPKGSTPGVRFSNNLMAEK